VLKGQLEKTYPHVDKIGILLDMDSDPLERNLQLMHEAVEYAFLVSPGFTAENEWKEITFTSAGNSNIRLQLSCFFTKGYWDEESGEIKSDKGNLDSLLFAIRKNPEVPVPFADCLGLWADCVNSSDSQLKVERDRFHRLWLDNYLRVKAKELIGKEGKKMLGDFEARKSDVIETVGAAAFDLDHPALKSLLDFFDGLRR